MEDNIEELFSDEDELEDIVEEPIEYVEEPIDSEVIDEIPVETPSNSYNPSFNNPNLFKRNTTSDSTTPNKLRELGKNRSFPQLGASNFSNEDNKSATEQIGNTVKNKVAEKAIAALTKGAVNGEKAEDVAQIASEISGIFQNKYKKQIIIISCVIACVFLLLVAIIGVASSDEEIGKDTNDYVIGTTNEDGSVVMSEEDLIKELQYYGYCDDENSCKSKGIYKFLTKLKSYYNDYKQQCPVNISINDPCEIELNTGLIIETMNYYQNSSEPFDTYNDPNASNVGQQEGFNIFDFFSELVNKFKKQQAVDVMIGEVEGLTLAQAEYVEETCQYLTEEEKTKDLKDGKVNNKEDKYKKYYYQISYDKYISYLKYGTTSTHPNYSGEPVKKQNEICEYSNNE